MKTKFLFILLLIISFIPLTDLINPGLPVTHDGQDHVARIANFYQNLQEGVLVPRWAPNLNWGYGHPILMFLYPLPSYIASLFHALGFSFVDSTKLVFAVAYILSGLAMFLWLKEFLSKEAAFTGSLLYIFAPYRFIDLYVRGAIGEHVAFVFPPLILYFLLKLSKKYSYKYLLLGSLSLAGFILSHNAISLMFLPIIILYAVYLISQSQQKSYILRHTSYIFLLGFALSAFFWLPAFMEGKYTLRDIVTKGGFENNFVSFHQFIYGLWNYGGSGTFSVQVGVLHWLSVLSSIPLCLYLYKKKNKLWIMVTGLLLIFITSLVLIDKNSQIIWQKLTLIQKFQFPWRFLSVAVFASSVLGAIAVSFIPKILFNKKLSTSVNLTSRISISIIIITAGILFLNKDYWHAKGYLYKPESFYTSVYPGTTDTGESAPVWSVRFMEKLPKSHVEVIQGQAEIIEGKRTATVHQYKISNAVNAGIRENTLYFPGWQVLVDDKPVDIQYQDANNRGVITFFVENGNHDLQIKFTQTRLRLIADIISIGSLLVLIGLGIMNRIDYKVIKSSSYKVVKRTFDLKTKGFLT
ncbi:glycosyltransferase family 39 protein [Patescibacteria group bacterium]|nr:glycosyltransferase family 39 protein [Patescibacteria group bacterium]